MLRIFVFFSKREREQILAQQLMLRFHGMRSELSERIFFALPLSWEILEERTNY